MDSLELCRKIDFGVPGLASRDLVFWVETGPG